MELVPAQERECSYFGLCGMDATFNLPLFTIDPVRMRDARISQPGRLGTSRRVRTAPGNFAISPAAAPVQQADSTQRTPAGVTPRLGTRCGGGVAGASATLLFQTKKMVKSEGERVKLRSVPNFTLYSSPFTLFPDLVSSSNRAGQPTRRGLFSFNNPHTTGSRAVAQPPRGLPFFPETPMNFLQVKSWYQSLGVWGGIGTIVVGLLSAMHIASQPGDAQAISDWCTALLTVVGGCIALYGRLRATKAITPVPPPSPTKLPILLFIANAALVVALVALSGCQNAASSTTQPSVLAPTQSQAVANVDAATKLFDATLLGIKAAEDAGWIKTSDVKQYQPVLDAVAAALAAAAADAANGNVSAGETALDELSAALPKLAPLLNKIATAQAAKSAPATSPAN